MKTFKDLKFNDHPAKNHGFGVQAMMHFENGYGISVVNGKYAYCSEGTYEVAVLKNGSLCYSTDITDDVLSYQSECDITGVMLKLQNMEP